MSTMKPDFREEIRLNEQGYKKIAGVDEVGRGSIAGKITAAAIIFPDNIRSAKYKTMGINDSKKLTPIKREKIYKLLTADVKIKWATASVSEKVIDKIGIHRANQIAILRAVKKLKPRPDFVIIDGRGFKSKGFDKYKNKFIIKADEKAMSCAAASIIAKVTRDREMSRLHKKYPQYGFGKHKGYGTKLHISMLRKYGPCEIHRRSFAPCKNWSGL